MKLIHLSDLHLGKRVNEFSMLEDQEFILKEILGIIDREAPQAVMLAGDVYDKSVPSEEAMKLFEWFLNALVKRKLHVFIISGNHDSAERISYFSKLVDAAGVHLAPVFDGSFSPVPLHDENGEVFFWMLPFVKPANVRSCYPEAADGIRTHTDAVAAALAHMATDCTKRNVLIAHQFVTGAATCDSEEHAVGGLDNVDASVFDGFDYVALGHIHGPQSIGKESVRYCGTPLKYSFSEKDHRKSVTVLDLPEKGSLSVRTVPLTPLRDLRELRGSFEDLTRDGSGTEDYVHAVLTDEEDIPNAIGRLRTFYPNLMRLDYDNTRTRASAKLQDIEELEQKSPIDLFAGFYEARNGKPMSEAQRAFSLKLFEELKEGDA